MNFRKPTPDETTGETTSHLTRLPKNDSQVIGYSHSTRLSKHDNQVAGYQSPFCKGGSEAPGAQGWVVALGARTSPSACGRDARGPVHRHTAQCAAPFDNLRTGLLTPYLLSCGHAGACGLFGVQMHGWRTSNPPQSPFCKGGGEAPGPSNLRTGMVGGAHPCIGLSPTITCQFVLAHDYLGLSFNL